MFATTLQREIERHALDMRVTNPFFAQAAAGTITPQTVARYLAGLRFMLRLTPSYFSRARDLSREKGYEAAMTCFAGKLAEEQGHDLWAEQDIQHIRLRFELGDDPEPVEAIFELSDYLWAMIERDPRLFLAYSLWAEYITVLMGGEFVSHLVERCGIPKAATSAIANHVELDREHAVAGFAALDTLVDETLLPALLTSVRDFTNIWNRSTVQLASLGAS